MRWPPVGPEARVRVGPTPVRALATGRGTGAAIGVAEYSVLSLRSYKLLGPLIIWKPGGENTPPVQFTHSLSALEEVLSAVFASKEDDAGKQTQKRAIAVFAEYCRRSDAIVLSDATYKEYYNQAKAALSSDAFAQLSAYSAPPSFSTSNESWIIRVDVVSPLKGIERHTLEGQLTPFSIRKYNVELIQNDALKTVHYVPGA